MRRPLRGAQAATTGADAPSSRAGGRDAGAARRARPRPRRTIVRGTAQQLPPGGVAEAAYCANSSMGAPFDRTCGASPDGTAGLLQGRRWRGRRGCPKHAARGIRQPEPGLPGPTTHAGRTLTARQRGRCDRAARPKPRPAPAHRRHARHTPGLAGSDHRHGAAVPPAAAPRNAMASLSSRVGTPSSAPSLVQLTAAAAFAKRSTRSVGHPWSSP